MEKQISLLLQEIIQEKYGILLEYIQLKFPPKKDLGDFAFNCAGLSRDLKKSPLLIAEELSLILMENKLIDAAELSGPYINLKISKTIFTEAFEGMFLDKENFLSPTISNNETIVVDYI